VTVTYVLAHATWHRIVAFKYHDAWSNEKCQTAYNWAHSLPSTTLNEHWIFLYSFKTKLVKTRVIYKCNFPQFTNFMFLEAEILADKQSSLEVFFIT